MEMEKGIFENTEDYLSMYEVFQDDDKNISRYTHSLLREDFQGAGQLSEIRKIENQLKYSEQLELFDLLSVLLESSDIEIRRVAVKNISKVNAQEEFLLQQKADTVIEQAVNSSDIQVLRIGMNMIDYASAGMRDKLIDISYHQIVRGLNSGDILKQKIFAKKINILSEDKRIELFNILYIEMLKWLKTKDVFAIRSVSQMVKYLPTGMQEEIKPLLNQFYEENKNNPELIKSGVYYGLASADLSKQNRVNFSKTGSRMILLFAEKLKYRALIRIVEDSCFLEWKRAYEASGLWKSLGFDYVPIEPIISYNRRKDGATNCVTGILDLNYDEWLSISGGKFKVELDTQKKKIDEGFKLLSIKHGHLNDDNYCLRFYRDMEGNIDFSKIPKIMVIDFDRAYRVEKVSV